MDSPEPRHKGSVTMATISTALRASTTALSGVAGSGSFAITADQLSILMGKDPKKSKKETQLQRYQRLGAHESILEIIRLGGGPGMGAQCERILRLQWPSLEPRESGRNTGYDHRIACPVTGVYKKLEQKTSGLWSEEENDFLWQHIELDHPWEGLLLVGIGIHGFLAWGMRREDFEECVRTSKATNQGNKEKNSSEGIWMKYRNVHDFLVPLLNDSDLMAFTSTL